MVAGSKNLESSILKQVQHDGMRCSPNNLRQSFQSRILNFVFDLLLGLTKNEEQVLALERRMSFQTNGTDSIFIALFSGWLGAEKRGLTEFIEKQTRFTDQNTHFVS
ncbi:hypothetical protein RJ60_04005 [Mesotoga sp. B105.6.4]|nr:hypothetical protein RJ60_04005 [Mesotoga sp. B105.6.4]